MPRDDRKFGPFEVSAISLGCMSLSHAYGQPPSAEHSGILLNQALDLGYTMLDSAALYGFGANEQLLGNAIGHRRDEYVLASKCGLDGVDGRRRLSNDPETLKQTCEDSLERLRTDVIDLYYLHRWDQITPIEEGIGALADFVGEGKIRAIGLSEVSADTLRRAHAEHPIAAVQTEYSLWTRDAEIAVLDACKELGSAFVAFSPIARGYLSGKLRDVSAFHEKDLRRKMPRFFPENYEQNLRLLDAFSAIADEHGCSMAQLALAWLLSVGDHIIAIPGTTDAAHLAENFGALDVTLAPGTAARLDGIFNRGTVAGERYVPATQAEIDTEQFAA